MQIDSAIPNRNNATAIVVCVLFSILFIFEYDGWMEGKEVI